MNLGHNETKPKTKSTLNFSRGETRDALIEYAKRNGYVFLDEKDVVFRFWDSPDHFELNAGCSGSEFSIVKTKDT